MSKVEPLRLAFSGRSGSGKDALASAVYEIAGVVPRKFSFGMHVVAEARNLLALAEEQAESPETARLVISTRFNVDLETASTALKKIAAYRQYGSTSEKHMGVPRPLLQWWGSDVRRSADTAYWIRAMADDLATLSPYAHACVTDCRFPDELALLRSWGFTTVRVYADEEIRMTRRVDRDGFCDPSSDRHATETALAETTFHDVVVDNGQDLTAAAHHVFTQISRRHHG